MIARKTAVVAIHSSSWRNLKKKTKQFLSLTLIDIYTTNGINIEAIANLIDSYVEIYSKEHIEPISGQFSHFIPPKNNRKP